MSRASHSPAPWRLADENCGGGFNIVDADGRRVAHTAEFRNKKQEPVEVDEAKANAALIVTAPGLLKLAKVALSTFEDLGLDEEHNYQCCGAEWSRARAYRGQGNPHAADCIRTALCAIIAKAEGGA